VGTFQYWGIALKMVVQSELTIFRRKPEQDMNTWRGQIRINHRNPTTLEPQGDSQVCGKI
jgi:hypothetical protein